MWTLARLGVVATLLSLVPAAASSAPPAPVAGLRYLVGTWSCTYRAGTTTMPYAATFAYDRDGHTLRETATFAGGGDEELIGYDAQKRSWGAVVVDDQGSATLMRGAGSDPKHLALHSFYPDASIVETIDRVSATEYTIHATVHAGATTTASVDTCLRTSRP